jgi:hypothetical protein
MNELKDQANLFVIGHKEIIERGMVVEPVTQCSNCPYVDDGSSTRDGGGVWQCHGAHVPGDMSDTGQSIIKLGPKAPLLPPSNCPLRAQPRFVMFATWKEVKRG